MADAPMTNSQREAIRRTARRRAENMGLAVVAQAAPSTPTDAEMLGETLARHPGVLRAMLATGRLSGAKAAAARRVLAEADRKDPNDTPEDAA